MYKISTILPMLFVVPRNHAFWLAVFYLTFVAQESHFPGYAHPWSFTDCVQLTKTTLITLWKLCSQTFIFEQVCLFPDWTL